MLLCKCATGLEALEGVYKLLNDFKREPREEIFAEAPNCELSWWCAEEKCRICRLSTGVTFSGEPLRIIISTWSYWKCMEILNQSNRSQSEQSKVAKNKLRFKKSISANHCNKSRFSFELQNSFHCAIKSNDDDDDSDEIQFRDWSWNLFPH